MASTNEDPERPATLAERDATFEAFYLERYTSTARLAYLLCGSNLVSEDLTQEAFMRVESRFPSIENPNAYLRTTLVRLTIDHHRRERRMAGALPAMYRDPNVSEATREMFDVLERLPQRQRMVLTLRYWLGMSFGEVAATLECRVSTVKSSARRGLATLRKELDHED